MALYLIEFSVVSYGKVIPERPFGLYTEDIVQVESSGNVPVKILFAHRDDSESPVVSRQILIEEYISLLYRPDIL